MNGKLTGVGNVSVSTTPLSSSTMPLGRLSAGRNRLLHPGGVRTVQ